MSLYPNIDLEDWKLQLPVDANGGFQGRYAEILRLDNYTSTYFHAGADGTIVLAAPVQGVTTGGSQYARSELREMDDGANAAWSLEEGGHLSVTMEVDEVPDKFDGTAAKIVIGQIHGGDHQLVRLYYDKGSIYWVNGRNEVQAKDVVHQFRDANGRTPSISLDEKFSYEFDVHGNDLTLSLRADGTTYSSRIEIGGGWSDNHFYFKAGLYLGTNETTSRGDGQVSVYDIRLGSDASHPVESPRPSPVTEPDPPTNPPSQPSPTVPASLTGTNQGDLLAGTQGDDVIAGRNGNDVIAGMGGHDVISGGTGSDLYRVGTLGTSVSHIQDWEAKDQLLLDADVFGAVASGVEAEHFVVGSAALERDDHIIFSQSTGRVLYDRDGSGTAAAVQFAEIENGMRLTHSDFDLI